MSNENVIRAFLDGKAAKTPTRNIQGGVYTYRGETLKTDGVELINYSTRIAFKKDGKLFLNVSKYSSTTSHIQSLLKRLANDYNYETIEYLGGER